MSAADMHAGADDAQYEALTFSSASTQETINLGSIFGGCLTAGDIVVLTGDLGAGKTQFTKGIAQGMHIQDDVTSPTFTIEMVYEGGDMPLYHFDLYRLSDPLQLEDTGLYDVLDSDGPCIIEWGEQFSDEIGSNRVDVTITRNEVDATTQDEPERTLVFTAHSPRSNELLRRFKQAYDARHDVAAASAPCATRIKEHLTHVLAFDTSSDMLACCAATLSMSASQNHEQQPASYATSELTQVVSHDHMCRRKANVELVTTSLTCLDEAHCATDNLSCIVVGRGPGSFTGVRIGIATAKGMACGGTIPLYGVSTLDAVAWHMWDAGIRGCVCVVADAMRHEIYPGIYTLSDSGVQRQFAIETVHKVQDVIDALVAHKDKDTMLFSGDALVKYREQFEQAGLCSIAPEELWHPTGVGLIRAYLHDVDTGNVQSGDPALVLPIYTRLSDAEEHERLRLGMKESSSILTTGVHDELAGLHLQLRPMSINDIEQVAALEQDVYANSSHTPWNKQQFYDELTQQGRTWWVAHDEASIIGFAGGVMAGSEIQLYDICVKQDRRHEHIASRLFERIAYDGQMYGAKTLTLEVDAHNTAAQALYSAMGATRVATRPHYYADGSDADILSVQLPLKYSREDNSSHHQQPAETAQPAASIRPWPPVCTPHTPQERERLAAAGDLILAIESSCDETGLAIIDSHGEVIAHAVATSLDFHARFGGVVPEIASRKHVEAIVGVYEEVMQQAAKHLHCAALYPTDLSAVGVTAGPGLVGALVVGIAFAKGLCATAHLAVIAVNHLEGHMLANLYETNDLKPPFIASLVSGGNTLLVHVKAWGQYEILGATIDDAVGEAFDKVSKALGLGYPGGPIISKLAAKGNKHAISFPRAMMYSHDYRFSLSGLKTAVITYIERENKAGRPINLPDLAASFEQAIIDVQVSKALCALEETGAREFCVGGGVAANTELRNAYIEEFTKRGIRVTVPPMVVCGDNGAMIALVALRNWRAGILSDFTLDANPNSKFGDWSCAAEPIVSPNWPPKRFPHGAHA